MSGEAQRELILHMSVSLDGFVAHSDGTLDWHGPGGSGAVDNGARRHRDNLEMLGQVGLIVIGRVAYEQMVQAWPGTDSPMGHLMNSLPKVIFSDTLETLDWENARLNERPLAEEIAELKREPGRDMIVIGGGHIANSLIEERLVDEYRLTIHPVALGEGISLMHGLPKPQRFELVSGTVYADGCVVQVLRPA